ncbi:MAG TPA: sulfite exporter TauE/SafE family protein [Thermoleophilaceae bacterium]|nr:sulfite exporter TauE/SafE family protein [Thermoleophilaceae bacterium]
MDADPLALAALVVWCFVVATAGGAVGLVLGNIRIPAVLAVASSPAAGAGANIGISGAAAIAAAIVHIRGGRIDWRVFAWMAPPSIVSALIGGYAAGLLPDAVLLAVIGATLVGFGVDMLRKRGRRPPAAEDGGPHIAALALAGLGIGLLGGLIGLILGALRMPALLRWVGGSAHQAVGTNLSVGVCVGIAGVIGHSPAGVDWGLLALGAAASVPGALLGARLTGRMSEQALLQAIGAMLVVAGTAMLAQAAL